mmetsp:Transcript_16250/g.18214  ORF Transcript_16250/g.18214 Transcript_16250/m.18214 type:complete len:86 (-) Transcript_16250:56-313(-)
MTSTETVGNTGAATCTNESNQQRAATCMNGSNQQQSRDTRKIGFATRKAGPRYTKEEGTVCVFFGTIGERSRKRSQDMETVGMKF